jgi:hypothetical protein
VKEAILDAFYLILDLFVHLVPFIAKVYKFHILSHVFDNQVKKKGLSYEPIPNVTQKLGFGCAKAQFLSHVRYTSLKFFSEIGSYINNLRCKEKLSKYSHKLN